MPMLNCLPRTVALSLATLWSVAVHGFDIIAHRGASGYLPEHTLAASAMAHAQSADYIEQDLVLSKDGQLIVLHDIYLDTVTDVEQQFPKRRRADGRWYAIDFTLAELKQLRVHERQAPNQQPVFPERYQGQGHFTLATFDEHISTLMSLNRVTGKQIGIYPEIKAPAFHHAHNQDIAKALVNALDKHGLNTANAKVIVQCFDFTETKRLRSQLGLKTKLVQIIGENSWQESSTDYEWLTSQDGLKTLRNYVDGVGPWYRQLYTESQDGHWLPSAFAQRLKNTELLVYPYTFRIDSLPANTTAKQWLDFLYAQGADGVFTDQVPPVSEWKRRAMSDSTGQ